MSFQNQLISFIGLLYVVKFFFAALLILKRILVRKLCSNGDLRTSFGPWAGKLKELNKLLKIVKLYLFLIFIVV